MCRFVYYLGPEITLGSLLTEPEHSLIHQSFGAREREEPLNGDGFGVAWYKPEVRAEPVLFKEVTPAWNSINLVSLAPVAHSHCILAHVRAASAGLAVTQLNCHPFSRGDLAFMHNGELASFKATRRRLLGQLSDVQFNLIQSTGDSEVLFALTMDRLGAAAPSPSIDEMAQAMHAAIGDVEDAAKEIESEHEAWLNTVLTDGEQAIVTRYVTPGGGAAQSLYIHRGGRYQCDDGVCMMVESENSDEAIIVSSEPLSSDRGWTAVPENTLLKIHRDGRIEEEPIVTSRRLGAV